MLLKSDILEETYSLLRVSGLTVEPSPADLTLGLRRLESLAAEFAIRQVDLRYNSKEAPDLADSAGIGLDKLYSLSCVLALRLFPDFGKGKDPDPVLLSLARSGASYLYSSTAVVSEVAAPNRQPIGSGNALSSIHNPFYNNPIPVPNEVQTIKMYIDDIDDFVESYEAYLHNGETITAYTLETDTGLTVTAEAISASAETIEYTIKAVGGDNDALRAKFVVTTSEGRVVTRVRTFLLTTVDM